VVVEIRKVTLSSFRQNDDDDDDDDDGY